MTPSPAKRLNSTTMQQCGTWRPCGFTWHGFGTYGSYLWSTGVTTPTIEVNPPPDEWFWVTVTSAGGCEESAAILVDPNIFADGFESGGTTAWSG